MVFDSLRSTGTGIFPPRSASADKVATARNGEFVAREARATTLLQDGDQVLLFQAIVGG